MFYFNKFGLKQQTVFCLFAYTLCSRITGQSITMEEAQECEQSSSQKASETTDNSDENRVLTFAELKELIETGNVDKIPNNKIIPEGLNVRRSPFLYFEAI